jgi:hypothetical protein
MLGRPCGALAALAAVLGTLAASPAPAWTPESHRVIAASAARLAPPDLHRQIARNRDAYLLGAVDPLRDGRPEHHVKNPDGSGRLDEMIALAVDNAIRSIRAHRPFNEIVYRLGVAAHYVADASNPLAVADGDPDEDRYASDFLRYLASTEPRLRTVFYGFQPGFNGDGDLPRLVDEAVRRGRGLYPLVGREYRRVGFRSGVETFSDRSTAFGVASLAYSHAQSDVAEVLRHVWLAAGGMDSRPRIPVRGRQVLLLPLDPAVR